MKKTRHFEVRQNQRGVSDHMLDLILEFGDTLGDRVYLDKKKVEKLIDEMRRFDKELKRISDKNGIIVVIEDDSMITTFPIYKRIHRMKVVR
jgi:hypothetical protein